MREDTRLHPDESKILAYAGPYLLKLLTRRREIILQRLKGDFRSGVRDFTAHVSEFCSVESLISDIEDTIRTHGKGGT